MTINELLEDFPEFKSEVYYGGPVSTDKIHFIHNVGDLLENSIEIAKGVFWGGDFEKLKFLISTDRVAPENVRFFVGYAGWTSDQLAAEIKMGSWIMSDSNSNYVFNGQRESLWSDVLQAKGNTFSVIAQLPDYSINN